MHRYQFLLSFKTYKFGLILAFFFGQGLLTFVQNLVQKAAKGPVGDAYAALPHALKARARTICVWPAAAPLPPPPRAFPPRLSRPQVALNLCLLMPFGTPFCRTWIDFGMFDAISKIFFTVACK